jgi:uncharacterized protein YneF (UPF0154 family)
MFKRIINFFKWLFVELPKQLKLFITTLKNDLPIMIILVIVSDFARMFLRNIFTGTNIPVILLEIISKVGIAYYINRKLVQSKCKNNPEFNTKNEILRTLVDSIIVLGFTTIGLIIIRFIPFVGIASRIISMIPFIGRAILWSIVFLLLTFIYSIFWIKPSNYCTNINKQDFIKMGIASVLFYFFNIRRLIRPIEKYQDDENYEDDDYY